ncbi:MAG: metallophosphoesterase [Clostridia bacterium]|nr:metallophosphoesterase [Clostridia bacterium]
MKSNKIIKRMVALCMSILLVLSATSASVLAQDAPAPLQIGIISDIHYYGETISGNYCDAYMDYVENGSRQQYQTTALLDSAFTALYEHAKENGMKYVLVPGDLTLNGEYLNHVEFAQKLREFEEKTGLKVFVTNGNHDINNYRGFSFENGTKEEARICTPEEFREIYADFGYDDAYHTFTPSSGKAGMLSYSAQLDGKYRLIVMDTNKYSADFTDKGEDKQETGGAISDELYEWVLAEIEDAKENGETPIGMAHHGFSEHYDLQSEIFTLFLIEDWQEKTEAFADAGMNFVLTGHMHDVSVTETVSDNGNVLYDISTPSLTGFPNYFREILFDNTGSYVTADIKTFDVDCVKPVTVDGVEYEQPYRLSYSFAKTFNEDGLTEYAMDAVQSFVDPFFDELHAKGLAEALKSEFGIDLETIINDLLKGGVKLGEIEIFTSKNIMSFVDDLSDQLCSTILSDKDALYGYVRNLIDSILGMQVSDQPCTAFIDTLGFGDASKPGTLDDLAMSVLAYQFGGNQDISDDAFVNDAIEFFRSGEGAGQLLDFLIEFIVEDLLQDKILGNIELNIDELFPCGTLGHVSMKLLDSFIWLIFGGDKSLENIVNSVLGLGIFGEFDSITSLVDHLAGEYLTSSQIESLGYTIAYMFEELLTDHGSGEDFERFLTNEKQEVEVTVDNYRLPSMVTVTLGEDASSERYINWYTKYSVTGSDIEIIPYSENPSFSGTPTTSGVTATCERYDRKYPGVDIGIIGFMDVWVPLNRHTMKITGLTPGKKYSYRVGDADKGWWSEPGVIETADNSDEVSFIHVTDSQSQNAVQYERFHTVITEAQKMYPDMDFVVSTGDQVDSGTNLNQWKWLLNISSDVLMDTSFMPTTGNHEDDGAALDHHFTLPNVPEQDTESGVYYAFDYNNVHVMVLNTNDLEDDKLSEKQIEWLKESAKSSDADWKIVALHKATYSNGSHFDDDDVKAMRKQFKKLMPELGIDVVLQGHDHVYLRTDAMYNNRVRKSQTKTLSFNGLDYNVKTDPCGSFYVISGCSGVKNYIAKDAEKTNKLFPQAECTYITENSVFSGFRIVGNTLYFDAYTVTPDGKTERIDNFAIEKTGVETLSGDSVRELDVTVDDWTEVDLGEIEVEVCADMDLIENDFPIPDEETTKANKETTTANSDNSDGEAEADTDDKKSDGNNSEESTTIIYANGSAGDDDTDSGNRGNNDDDAIPGIGASDDKEQKPGEELGGFLSDSDDDSEDEDADREAEAEDEDDVRPMTYSFTGGGIPKLGGEKPTIAISVLFAASLAAMAALSKKKKDEE